MAAIISVFLSISEKNHLFIKRFNCKRYVDEFMQERDNSIANALLLHLLWANPLMQC